MVYRLHFITAAGTSNINANPFDSIESAMTAARPARADEIARRLLSQFDLA